MSIYYYHPLGDYAKTYNRNIDHYYTYSDGYHVAGEIDVGVTTGVAQYAMCDGIITSAGKWDDDYGTTYAILECKANQNGLNDTFYIRYLHGDYTVKTGQIVKAGDKIGTTASHGDVTGPHLHIGFSHSKNGYRDPTVTGKLQIRNGKHYYIYKNKEYSIDDDLNIDWNLIEQWKAQLKVTDDDIGYCWLVLASEFKEIKADNTVINETMDVSSKFKNENDWLALYGMLWYEESGLAQKLNDDISKGICEWVVRVFRNRLFSGLTIQQICLWNSNQPGYSTAVSLGKNLPQKARDFCKDIISGKDYFYVEKIAQKYRYSSTSSWNDIKWFNRLYSADTFYGGNSARWPDSTLAAVPFSGGPYFFMEGEFTNKVLNKFWPNGRDGAAAYPNPYLSR